MDKGELLRIQNLSVEFETDDGIVHAVDDVSLEVGKGKTVCLVGESGCGKSVTSQAIMRLIQQPPGKISSGEILFEGRDLLKLDGRQIRAVRGAEIAMVFQDPMVSLNPVYTCGYQIAELLRTHTEMSRAQAMDKAVELLRQVRIPDPEKRVREYPHQLSGGMRQRVMIAMALSCNPKLLIADEPTTALDVTVQAQILRLMAQIKEQRHMSMLFITHDLGIVAEIADEVVVLYAGKVAERGTARDIYENPKHPYTMGLLKSVPVLGSQSDKLHVIPGTLPNASAYPTGCRFYDRCDRRTEECKKQPPEFDMGGIHKAACFNTH
jgi:oligopeptide/dipeptide ABC transporter ATP-binding protein